jgi:hypothetical protein
VAFSNLQKLCFCQKKPALFLKVHLQNNPSPHRLTLRSPRQYTQLGWAWGRIKHGALTKRLCGTSTGGAGSRNAILTNTELNMLVKVCRYKNLIGTPADKKWVGEQVVCLLSNRARLNTGRNYMKLNDAAKRTVRRGKISDPVFQRIMTHPAIKQKSLRTTDNRRFQHSTQEHSNIYFEKFVEAAKELGIATVDDPGNVTSLDLSRCLTSDEAPSIIGQSNRGGSGSSVIAGFGDAVAKTIMDNKRRISYDPWLTLSGVWVLHHFILPG